MSNRWFPATLLVLLAVAPCSMAQSVETAALEREEYAVYSATIPAVYNKESVGQFVISNPTSSGLGPIAKKDISFAMPGAPTGLPETFEDYSQRNKTNRWLERHFNLDVDYAVVDFREIKKLVSDFSPLDDWKDYHKKYPGSGGFITLSRVGLNLSMDEALVYVHWTCPGLCGLGEIILLAKKDNAWKVVNRARLNVS